MPQHAAFFGLLTTLVLSGCMLESPLSNKHLTDPKLIRPHFELVKERAPASTFYAFKAKLEDRKGDPVEILNGGVYLNGIKMNVIHTDFGDLPSYTLSSSKLRFKLDSLYTFTVMLSDGSKYSSSVRTPKFEVASTAVKIANGAASITWSGDTVGPLDLNYVLTQNSYNNPRTLTYTPVKNPDTLRVWMEGQKLTQYSLGTTRAGEVNPAFRSGGTFTVKVSAVWPGP